MFGERFGFLFACLLTASVLAVVFIKADVLLREPDTATRQLAPAASSPQALLSITTQPASAAIFINGEFAGLSPLTDHALDAGKHRISAQVQDHASLDTVLTLTDEPVRLHLALHAVEHDAAVDDSRDAPPPALAAAEPNLDASMPPVDQEPPPDPVSIEEQPTITPEVAPADQEDPTTLLPDDTSTDPAAEDQSDTDAGDAETPAPEEPPVEVGELQIRSQPSGASVWLAGRRVGVTPLLLTDVESGAQPVTLRLEGYEPFTTTVMVASEQRSEVDGALIQRLGTLKILAKPWGNIYIDGKLLKSESSIWYTAKLSPGNHRVRIEHPSLGKWEQVVIVSLEEEGKIEVDFNKGNSPSQ